MSKTAQKDTTFKKKTGPNLGHHGGTKPSGYPHLQPFAANLRGGPRRNKKSYQ